MPSLLVLHLLVAAPAANLLGNGDFAAGTRDWQLDGPVRGELVDAEAGPYRRALRLRLTPRAGSDPWAILLDQRLRHPLRAGESLAARFWARSPERCRMNVYVQLAREPWTRSLSAELRLTPEWREYSLDGAAETAYAAAETSFGLHLSYDTGTIELAGLRLTRPDAAAGGPRPTPEAPWTMITNGDFRDPLVNGWSIVGGERLTAEPVAADLGGLDRAVRLTTRPDAGQPVYHVQFAQTVQVPVRRGDAVYFRAWMRSPDALSVTFIFELAEPPHTKWIDRLVRLTPEWREYRFVGRPDRRLEAGQSSVKWFLGHGAGSAELAGVRLENYGDAPPDQFAETIDWWAGRPHPDDWRAPALERIERLRKGDLAVRVVDPEGRPVPGARVRGEMLRHHFKWGTAAPAGRLVDTTNPDNARFREVLERLFNTVTFENDLKWVAESEATLARVDQAAAWLAERDIALRGHCLVWGSYQHLPTRARDLRGAELREAVRQHVTDYATRMAGRLYLWDVVNEAGNNTDLWDEIGWEQFAEVFRLARQADPEALLCYNDFGILQDPSAHRALVRARIEQLLAAGAPVDVLGLQGHLSVPLTPVDRMLEILDEWAAFGQRLEITEFDIGVTDDAVHGEYVRDVLIAAFSHPAVDAFIQWGFWEGSHWRARESGHLFRRDWSPRPAAQEFERLVKGEWWSRLEGESNGAGQLVLRPFHGRHRVTAEAGGRRGEAVIDTAPGAAAEVTVVVR